MIWLLALIFGGAAPDPAPIHSAVDSCNRAAVAELTKAEPHRRAEFAQAAYAEQRAIIAARAALAQSATVAAVPPGPAGSATLGAARAALDTRQQALDDARALEKSWRDMLDELRADFLANCAGGKQAGNGK